MTFGPESDIEVLEHVASDLALAQASIAKAYHDRDQLDEGLPWVEEALRLDPDLPQAHLVSGFLNFRLRNANEAIRDFKKVMELDPTEFDAYLYLGLIYNGRENPDQSLRYLNRAVELASTVEERSIALTYRAIAYSLLWRYDEAFEDLRFAQILDSDNGWITITRSSIDRAITIRQDLIPEDPYVEKEWGSQQKLDFGN
jgi:tetratricopeptide (TPR) repeat protein